MIPSRVALRLLLRVRAAAAADNLALSSSSVSLRVDLQPLTFSAKSLRKIATNDRQRGFASSADAVEESNFGRELQIRFVRIIAFGMILVAATKVVPMMFQSTVPHVQLCDAKEPLMQKAAASRVHRLAENDKQLQELIDAGVAHKLLAMLKSDVESGVATAVLLAVKELSRLPEGIAALKSAGAVAIPEKALQEEWFPTQHDSRQEAAKISRWLQTG